MSKIVRLKILMLLAILILSSYSFATVKQLNQTILFVRGGGDIFAEVEKKMSEDLSNYKLEEAVIKSYEDYPEFVKKVTSLQPSLLILMDNKSVEFGLRWNREHERKIRGVALMGLNLQSILKNNEHIAGIAFEPPAYTLVTQFRYYTNLSIKNVLVFYRKSVFSEIIEQARTQLLTEGINLDAIDVEQSGKSADKIEMFLKTEGVAYLNKKVKYDALWCILDSVLLSESLFRDFWQSALGKSNIPILTGVEQLVSTNISFGIFAVTPNLIDLSSQAVQIVEQILDQRKANPAQIGVEQLISVDKILNQKRAKELGIKIYQDRLSDVKILK